MQILENQNKLYFFRSGSGAIKTETGRYFKTGKKGCPDITVCLPNGLFLAIEVKTLAGQLSSSQKGTKGLIESLGGYYHVVRSVEDVSLILKEKRIL